MKRIFSFLVVLIATGFHLIAMADTWDGSAAEWTHGSGTEADPYLIESAANLAWLQEMVNGGVSTYSGQYFKLTTDIDLNSILWLGIGTSETVIFQGRFDGDNHRITGINSTRALFAYVKDFILKNLSTDGDSVVSGIIQYSYGTTSVDNCHSAVVATKSGLSGGIIGIAYGTCTITNCSNVGNVRGTDAGGIVGYASETCTITNCSNVGNVRGTNAAGGIIGRASSSCIITNCSNSGSIENSGSGAGGIIGVASNTCTITNCYNTGSVSMYWRGSVSGSVSTTISFNRCAGGIIGEKKGAGTTAIIQRCFNTGGISATFYGEYSYETNASIHAKMNSYAGGIVGCISAGMCNISLCYNKGACSSSAKCTVRNNYYSSSSSTYYKPYSSSYAYSGGIVGGSNVTDSIENCYNRGNCTAQTMEGMSYYYFRFCANGIDYTQREYSSSNYERKSFSAGISYGESITNTNCYSTGTVTATTNQFAIGNGTITNCYYLSTCGGSGVGTSKAENIMKSASMPILLNATDEFFFMDITPNSNDGYPILGNMLYVVTSDVTNVGFRGATVNGVCFLGSEHTDVQGFEYKKNTESTYHTVYTNVGSPFNYDLSNLEPETIYKYKAFVTKDGMTIYGEEKTFTTLSCSTTLTAAIDASVTETCADDTATLTASGASDYSENFTYLWNTEATTAVIRPTESGTYTVTVTDDNGCTATESVTLTVNPLPVGTISGRTSICSGNSTTLTASGANSYTWSTGATTPTLTTSTAGTYTCTFRNSYGCTSTQDVTISVFAAPVITGSTAICSGNSTTLTASGADSYTWSNGATTPSITVSQAGTYTVTGTTTDGCNGSAGVTVSVGALPTIAISGNPSFCQGGNTVLTATGGISYAWANGTNDNTITVTTPGTYVVTGTNADGCSNTASIEVAMSPSYINMPVSAAICHGASYNAMGTNYSTAGTYHVEGTTAEGCDSIIDLTLTVNPLPTPSITGNTSICQGTSTTLAALGGTSFLWNNGSSSQAISVSNAGVYSVTVTDANGCSNSTSATVSVNPLPTVTIAGNTTICAGSSTTLTASGADSYQWSTGATGTSITVTNGGTYTVTGTSTNGCQNTAAATVTVNPTYNGVPVSQAICEGNSYNFFGTMLNEAGTYTQNGTTMAGCDSVVNLTLTVNPLPTATISGNTIFCEGNNTTLTATGGASYLWNDGTTTSSISVANGGAYSVTVTDANGCSNTSSTTVTVNPRPNIVINGNSSFCQGSSTTLTAIGADSYLWSTGSSNASIPVYNAGSYSVTGTSAAGCTNSASVTVAVNPVYNIPVTEAICQGNSYNFFGQNLATSGRYTHTLQTPAGCDSTINLTLTVNPLPTATISGNTTFCEGGNTTLTANGGVSYTWSNGANTSAITVTNAGTYGVTVTDANGCTNTASTTVTVNTLPTITISGNTAFCEGNSTMLTAQGGNSYTWSNGAQTSYITVTSSGNYTVTGVGANGCSNTASVTVTASPLPTITIGGNTFFCQGGSTTLTATGADSYAWSNGTTTPSITVDAFGVYSVTGTTALGCTGTASVTVTVSPNPTITITGDTELCPGETTTLTANGGTSYMWFDGSSNATYQTSTAGNYSVIGYNDAGCYAMASVDVQQYDNAQTEETATGTGEYVWNGNIYTESGDYTFTTTTAHGCDSTVTLHLTIEQGGGQGIDDITDANNVKVYAKGGKIVVVGAKDEKVHVYDVMGRTFYNDIFESPITLPAAGVYMVKIGEGKPHKVVVRP